MKKKEKSQRSKSHKKEVEPKIQRPPVIQEENSNPMDFGGIPNRDLKKNLGCG